MTLSSFSVPSRQTLAVNSVSSGGGWGQYGFYTLSPPRPARNTFSHTGVGEYTWSASIIIKNTWFVPFSIRLAIDIHNSFSKDAVCLIDNSL